MNKIFDKNTIFEFINNTNRALLSFFVTLLSGFIVHGFALFNPIINYDALYTRFGVGATVTLGRWTLDIINNILSKCGYSMAIPCINVLTTILLIAIASYFVNKSFNFKSIFTTIILSFIMIASPAIVEMMHFAFTIHVDALAILLFSIAFYFISKEQINIKYGVCAILIASIALGIYQAYLPYFVTLLCFKILFFTITFSKKFSELLILAIKYVVIVILIVVFYVIEYKIYCLIKYGSTSQISHYMGMGDSIIPSVTVNNIFLALLKCYGIIFSLPFRSYGELNNTLLSKFVFLVLIGVSIISIIIYVIDNVKNHKHSILMTIICLITLPITCNLIKLMTFAGTQTRMTYSLSFIVLLPCFFIFEYYDYSECFLKIKDILSRVVIIVSACLIICMTNCAYGNYYDNYLANKLSTVYATQMITRIQSIKGYDVNMPIYIYKGERDDFSELQIFSNSNKFFDKQTYGLFNDININYDIYHSLEYLGGLKYKIANEEEKTKVKNSKEFLNMNIYPNDNSIRIIDNIVVVKICE